MALDLFSPLKVVSWASAHADCPMRYEITSARELVITFGSDATEFEFSLDKGALRNLVQLGTEALAKLEGEHRGMAGRAGAVRGAPGMSGHLVPGDQAFHDDKQLMADLTALNGQLSMYVLRQLDADAGRIGPTSPDDERALAETMTGLARQVRERAEQ